MLNFMNLPGLRRWRHDPHLAAWFFWLVAAASAWSEETPNSQSPATPPERIVAALVDGRPIYVDEVRRRIERVIGERKVEPEAQPALEAETLAHLVDRQLALRFLQSRNLAASDQDAEAEIAKLERRLAQQDVTLEQFLQRTGQSREDLKQAYRWELSWRRYLERNLTDENLERYFARHRREFDGTELRVAHILLKPANADDRVALQESLNAAEKIRAQITGGEISFAEAAKKHSTSPTADQGGDIGLIGRRGPMPEPFSAAAFALKAGEVSQPVVTAFGVHLIQVLETKPGKAAWEDIRGELEQAVGTYLFSWCAGQQRPNSQIEFTGALPHYKPGTKQLAE